MNSKKKRNMTPKGFLKKASGSVSAQAFLEGHRDWLKNLGLSTVVDPIMVSLENKEVMPKQALTQVTRIVFDHMQAEAIETAKKSLEKKSSNKTYKAFVTCIFDKDGVLATYINEKGEEVDAEKDFNLPQEAERWADRKLVDAAPDSYAVISDTRITDAHGHALTTVVKRSDAIARILKNKKGAAMYTKKSTSSGLSFGVKASNSVAYFSRG